MQVYTVSDRYPVVDNKLMKSRIPTTIAEPDISYENLWDESEKTQSEDGKDLSKWLAKLKSALGHPAKIKDYYEWVDKRLSETAKPTLKPYELAIDLKKASWIEENHNLSHLNSLLTCSITDTSNLLEDLKRTYLDCSLGLQIHGRPLEPLHADAEEYADKGIAINSELVLALGYHAHIKGVVKPGPEKTTMLFVPLGHIFARSVQSRPWVRTGLVLIAEIRDNGKAGSLYLILPPDSYGDADFEMMSVQSGGVRDPEGIEVQKFRSHRSFTVARLEDKFELLENIPTEPVKDLDITVISKSSVEIVETGSTTTGEPSIPFALYPDDEPI